MGHPIRRSGNIVSTCMVRVVASLTFLHTVAYGFGVYVQYV